MRRGGLSQACFGPVRCQHERAAVMHGRPAACTGDTALPYVMRTMPHAASRRPGARSVSQRSSSPRTAATTACQSPNFG